MEMTISQEQGRVPVTVFHLKGDLTETEPLQSQAQAAYAGGMRHLLLDLTEVPYISSAGLRALHSLYSLLRTAEDDQAVREGIAAGTYKSPYLKLLKPSKSARKALTVAGYDMFLEIHDHLAQAIASF